MGNEHDVTLAEVNRNVSELRGDIKNLAIDVTELRIASSTQESRVKRLETTVYGVGAVAISGLVTAILGVVFTG